MDLMRSLLEEDEGEANEAGCSEPVGPRSYARAETRLNSLRRFGRLLDHAEFGVVRRTGNFACEVAHHVALPLRAEFGDEEVVPFLQYGTLLGDAAELARAR